LADRQVSRPFRTKYGGPCLMCEAGIKPGHMIILDSSSGTKLVFHANCDDPTGDAHRRGPKYQVHQNAHKPNDWRRKIRRK